LVPNSSMINFKKFFFLNGFQSFSFEKTQPRRIRRTNIKIRESTLKKRQNYFSSHSGPWYLHWPKKHAQIRHVRFIIKILFDKISFISLKTLSIYKNYIFYNYDIQNHNLYRKLRVGLETMKRGKRLFWYK
jgi:hypothetical protein